MEIVGYYTLFYKSGLKPKKRDLLKYLLTNIEIVQFVISM